MELLFSVFAVISLAAILLLGIETGLLSRFFKYDLKKHIIIAAVYALVILAVIVLLSPYYKEILSLTFYSFYYYIIMGIVCFVLGAVTLVLWNRSKTYNTAMKVLLYIDFVPISYTLLLISTALLAPSFDFKAVNLSLTLTTINSAVVLVVLMALISIIFYLCADFVEDYRISEYSIIFGSMLLIFGFAFIVLGFIIPNMAQVFSNPSTELTLMPLESVVIVVVALAVLLGLGYLFKKRSNRLE